LSGHDDLKLLYCSAAAGGDRVNQAGEIMATAKKAAKKAAKKKAPAKKSGAKKAAKKGAGGFGSALTR
jgi:hypothetical protein